MLVRKRTSGTEADRILNELARVMDAHADVAVSRLDAETLELTTSGLGGTRLEARVEETLAVVSPSWPIHVGIQA